MVVVVVIVVVVVVVVIAVIVVIVVVSLVAYILDAFYESSKHIGFYSTSTEWSVSPRES